MRSLAVGLVLAGLIAVPLAADAKDEWPDFKKWSLTDVEPYLVTPQNSGTEYGNPYISRIEVELGKVCWYYDDFDNPTMRGTELEIFFKVVGRSLQKRGEPATYQLLVDGKWVDLATGLTVYLLDAETLIRSGKMKGVILEAVAAEDGRVLRVTVTL